MINGLNVFKGDLFKFNLIPVFKAYEETAAYYVYPTPENVRDVYDINVNWKLRELDFSLNPSEYNIRYTHRWDLFTESEEVLNNLEELIEMKPVIETRELIDIMDTFQLMYVDDYDILNNFPIKAVW